MTSIERTAYPRFGRVVTARELAGLSPTGDQVAWARDRSRSDAHLLSLVVSLKCFQRLGYFSRRDQAPESVVDHMQRRLDLPATTTLEPGSERTAESQRELVRERVGVVLDPRRARAVVAEAIREAAEVKNRATGPDQRSSNDAFTRISNATTTTGGTPVGYLGGSGSEPTVELHTGQVASAVFEGLGGPLPGGPACTPYSTLLVTPPNNTQPVRIPSPAPYNNSPCYPQIHPIVAGTTGGANTPN